MTWRWCFSWDYSIEYSVHLVHSSSRFSQKTPRYIPRYNEKQRLQLSYLRFTLGTFELPHWPTGEMSACVRDCIFYGSERSKSRFPFARRATWWDSLREHIFHLTFQVSQRSSFFIYKIRVISMNSQCKIQGTERNQQALKDSFHPWPCCFVNDTRKGQCILFAGYKRRKTLCRLNNHVRNIF